MRSWADAAEKVVTIGIGGFLGANARYWLGGWIQERWGTSFPWATFIINVSGSFALGLFAFLLTERFALPRSPQLRLLVAVGFLGAYTTFSTFEMETLSLVTSGSWKVAMLNAIGSLIAGFAAVCLGAYLFRLRLQ